MRRLTLVLTLTGLLLPGLSAGAVLTYCASDGTRSQLYALDTDTRIETFLLTAEGVVCGDLASSADPEIVYLADRGTALQLVAFNVTTLAVTPVGPFGLEIKGLAWDGSTLYGTDYFSLYTVDTATGAATLVGSFSGPTNLWAFGADSRDGTLYGVNATDDLFYTIDPATGLATAVGATGEDRITDVYLEPGSGTLYAVTNIGRRVLTVIDPVTGRAGPEIMNLSHDVAVGLAAPPEEPALAVVYLLYEAVPSGAGLLVRWSTLEELGSVAYEVWARDAAGTSWAIPGLVMADGRSNSYVKLVGSPGDAVAWRVLELTADGPGDATPWFPATVPVEAGSGWRRRAR